MCLLLFQDEEHGDVPSNLEMIPARLPAPPQQAAPQTAVAAASDGAAANLSLDGLTGTFNHCKIYIRHFLCLPSKSVIVPRPLC